MIVVEIMCLALQEEPVEVVVHNQEPLDMVGQNQVVFSFA
jgi:hypothetical protein